MADLTPHDIGWFESAEELREWLAEHHTTAAEKWIGTRPKASGLPSVTWEEIVDEVLCVGWIDGIRKRVDGGSAQRITPRRDGSVWSARNVGRVEALRAAGRMRPAGEAAFGRRRADRTAIYSFEANLGFDAAAQAAMRRDVAGWAFWEAQPPGYRRLGTHWVMSAKRPDTRERRLVQLVQACAAGERLPVLTGTARPAAKG
jgi:uncharacterized protein YdeI (YjbR/CyaY-like superfamily)